MRRGVGAGSGRRATRCPLRPRPAPATRRVRATIGSPGKKETCISYHFFTADMPLFASRMNIRHALVAVTLVERGVEWRRPQASIEALACVLAAPSALGPAGRGGLSNLTAHYTVSVSGGAVAPAARRPGGVRATRGACARLPSRPPVPPRGQRGPAAAALHPSAPFIPPPPLGGRDETRRRRRPLHARQREWGGAGPGGAFAPLAPRPALLLV